jgi:hypothetical protein
MHHACSLTEAGELNVDIMELSNLDAEDPALDTWLKLISSTTQVC